ncbi:MAG TPA: hypothetical protein PLH11_09555 [Gemmobacter sp.]|nr:hypothetical protein [Gemmobacter sp.]
MMTANLRKLLVSVAVSALLAGPALAEGDDTPVDDGGAVSLEGPDVSVDPMPEGEPDMWTGGSPDFCEACTGEPIDEPSDIGGGEGDDGAVDEPQVDEPQLNEPVTLEVTGDDVTDLGVDPNDIEPRIRETMADGEGLGRAPAQARNTVEKSGGECVWTPRQMHCRD